MRRGSKSIHKYNAFGRGGCCQLYALLPAAIIYPFAACKTNDEAALRQLVGY